MRFAFELIDRATGPAARIAGQLARVDKALGDNAKAMSLLEGKTDKTSLKTLKSLQKQTDALHKQKVQLLGGQVAVASKMSAEAKLADKVDAGTKKTEAQGSALGKLATFATMATSALLTMASAGGAAAAAGGKMLAEAQEYRDTAGAALKFQLGSAEAAEKTMALLARVSRATGQDRREVTEQFSKLLGSGLTTNDSAMLVQLAADLKVATGGRGVGVEKLGEAVLALKRNEALTVEKSFAGLIDAGGKNRVYETLAKQLNIKTAGLDPIAIQRAVDRRLSGENGGMGLRGKKALDLFAKVNLEVAGVDKAGKVKQAFQASTITGAIDLIKQRIRGLFDDANASPLATRILGILNKVATALDPGSESGKQLLATLDRMIVAAGDLWDFLKPLATALGEGFGQGFTEAADTVGEVIGLLGDGKGSAVGFGEALRMIGTALGYVVVGIGTGLGAIAMLGAKLAGIAAYLAGAAVSIGVAVVDGITNGLESAKSRLISRLNALAELLPESVRKLLQIRSPSRVMMRLGAFSAEGFVQGVERGAGGVERAAEAGIAQPVVRVDARAAASGGRGPLFGPGSVVVDARGAREGIDIERAVEEGIRRALTSMNAELGAPT